MEIDLTKIGYEIPGFSTSEFRDGDESPGTAERLEQGGYQGRAVALAVSRRLPTVAARVRTRNKFFL
jgi:hypothetical protein